MLKWSDSFNDQMFRWMFGKGRTPQCPDCGHPVLEFSTRLGQPVRILFRCGHQCESPVPGIQKREPA